MIYHECAASDINTYNKIFQLMIRVVDSSMRAAAAAFPTKYFLCIEVTWNKKERKIEDRDREGVQTLTIDLHRIWTWRSIFLLFFLLLAKAGTHDTRSHTHRRCQHFDTKWKFWYISVQRCPFERCNNKST